MIENNGALVSLMKQTINNPYLKIGAALFQ